MLEEVFAQGDSFLHQADPRGKLLIAFAYTISLALLQTLIAGMAAIFISFCLVLLSQVPMIKLIQRLFLINGFIAFLWIFLPFSAPGEPIFELWQWTATLQGVKLACLITLKSNAIVLGIIALVSTTSIAKLGQALSCLRLPQKFTLLFLITYRYLNVLFEEYKRLVTAAQIRGFVPKTNMHTYKTYGYLLAMVLIKSYDRAQRVYQAMLLRGFNGRFYTLHEFVLSSKDIFFISSMSFFILCIIVLDFYLQFI